VCVCARARARSRSRNSENFDLLCHLCSFVYPCVRSSCVLQSFFFVIFKTWFWYSYNSFFFVLVVCKLCNRNLAPLFVFLDVLFLFFHLYMHYNLFVFRELSAPWQLLKLYDLCGSPNIIRVIKLRLMRCADHEAHMGKWEVRTWVWWGNPEGKKPLGRPVLG